MTEWNVKIRNEAMQAGTVRMKRVPLQDLEAALEQYATIPAAVAYWTRRPVSNQLL
ncbi:MAG: hypothetical protein QGG53_10205 [Planctomycetota bacterium]|nr:hypothetical protein [Planctomycetota bacterium]